MKHALFFMLVCLLTVPACASAGGSGGAVPIQERSQYVIEYKLQPEAADTFACEVGQVSGTYECGYEFAELDSADQATARRHLKWTKTVNIGYEEKPQILEKLVRNWNAVVNAIPLAVAADTAAADLRVVEYGDPPPDVVRCFQDKQSHRNCSNLFYKFHFRVHDVSEFYGPRVAENINRSGEARLAYRFSESRSGDMLSLVEGIIVADAKGAIDVVDCYVWKGHTDEIKSKLLNECVVLGTGMPAFLTKASGNPLRGGDPDFIDELLANSPILNLDLEYICSLKSDQCSTASDPISK